jgi:hypothetical protein
MVAAKASTAAAMSKSARMFSSLIVFVDPHARKVLRAHSWQLTLIRKHLPAKHRAVLNLSRSELAQNFLAGWRERGCLCSQTLHDPTAAGLNASAKRANITPACRPQDE